MHIFRGAAPGWGRVVCWCLSSREKTVELRSGVRLGSQKLPLQQIFLIHPQDSLRYFPVHTRSGKSVACLSSSSSSSSLDTQNTRDCGSETYTVILQEKKTLNETYPASWVSFPWLLQRHFKTDVRGSNTCWTQITTTGSYLYPLLIKLY